MNSSNNNLLIVAAIFSACAALAHLGCIIGGGDWYRFFGAGEEMAQMAEAGDWHPTIVTTVIVVMLAIWSLYALSGAKIITRLPFLKLGLVVISFIYLLRGLTFVVLMPMFPENSLQFWLVSSSICLCIGGLYAIGTYQSWSNFEKGNIN